MSTFEDRLAAAIDETLQFQTAGKGRFNTAELAATLIALDIVADPVQHQQDLVAIMDKQVRDAEGWSDEFVTAYVEPDDLTPAELSTMTTDHPAWPSAQDFAGVYHRRVTEWREVRRA